MASLGLVSPGAATDGVIPISCVKTDDLFSHLLGANKHSLGGGSEVSANRREAAGRAARGRTHMVPVDG